MYFDLPFCHPKGLYICPLSLALVAKLCISFVGIYNLAVVSSLLDIFLVGDVLFLGVITLTCSKTSNC